MRYVWAALLALGAGPAMAQMLTEGEERRSLPFTVMDGKPMLPVTVAGQDGVMMFDLGTPSPVFLNRGAAVLPPGVEVGRGFAASGQEIVVQLHDAPAVAVAGQALALPAKVQSGDFSFAEGAFGADFMGFLGLPAVADHAVLLDYGRAALGVIAVRDGVMVVAPPDPKDVIATLDVLMIPDELPLAVGRIGEVPIQISLDTGDSGTAYLTPATRARLAAAGLLAEGPTGLWELSGLTLGGSLMLPTPVALIEAGGEADHRVSGQPDELRLGAAFFATYPTLWEFPARRVLILRPDAAILAVAAP
ncbi:MAG: hypothetical protein O9328_12080 [Rhodobacteraceae bacterium]|nr:hypothetical protein [Paracoccaceae bacterium]